MKYKKIPEEITVSKCPKCIGEVSTFVWGVWFCTECKGIWKDGKFRKSKLTLPEFLANQLK